MVLFNFSVPNNGFNQNYLSMTKRRTNLTVRAGDDTNRNVEQNPTANKMIPMAAPKI